MGLPSAGQASAQASAQANDGAETTVAPGAEPGPAMEMVPPGIEAGAEPVREAASQPAVIAVAPPQVIGSGAVSMPALAQARATPAAAGRPDPGPRLDPAFSEPPLVAAPPPSPVDLSERSVLIADACGQVFDALSKTLAPTGVQLARAMTGKDALGGVGKVLPDLVIVDATLPEMHGLELCCRLRKQERSAKLPIVVFSDTYTGWRLEADLRDCFGVEALFETPAELSRLARTVVRLLRGQPLTDAPCALGAEIEAELRAGMADFEAGNLDGAIAHLETGVRMDPSAFQMQYHLGLLYGRRDDLFAAMQALEAATRLQKRHFAALKNLAVVYQRARFRRKALETWERAMWTAPDEETRRTIKEHMVAML